MESYDHPFRISRMSLHNAFVAYGKYIWQAEDEQDWMLDRCRSSHQFDRAIPGEY